MKQILILIIAYCSATGARGQLFDTSAAQTELVATLMGTGRVFTASVTVIREHGDKQIKIADNVMSMRAGDICLEHNPTAESSLVKLTAKLKKNNLAEVTTILLPKTGKAYLLFPGKHAYIESPVEPTTAPRIESKFLRAETVNGRLCAVRRVTVTDADDSSQQIIIWESADLQSFIIKSKMDCGDDTNEILLFTDIRSEKPEDAKFTVPSDYRELNGKAAGEIAKLMMEVEAMRDAVIEQALR